MEALNALVLKMVAGLDLKGFEKMKEDIYLLFADESYPDVKPDVDENLARKEDYEDVEKVKPEETEDIQFKYDDKLDDPLNDEDLDEKEEYEVVEKVKDDLEKVKFSEIKENDENYDKLKETEEVILIKYEDKT